MKTSRTERFLIKKTSTKYQELYKIFNELSWQSKNLYNYANYIIRQEFIETTKQKEQGLRDNANWIQYNELFQLCKESAPYIALGSNVGQATLRKLEKNWKSYFSSIKDWSKHKEKYKGMPKMPKYLDKDYGRYEVGLDNNKVKCIDGYVYFCWKPLKFANNTFKSIYPDGRILSTRIVPNGNDYVLECIHEIELEEKEIESKRIAAIDLGIDNLMTITTNCGITPIVINGKPLKSMNQYYNKKHAELQSDLMLKNNKHFSNRLQRLTTKRNNKIDNYLHTASKMVIDWCIENNIDSLVCGYNAGWKQESDIGKVNNQKFVGIPYYSLVQKLEYKCEDAGIKFITTEESYTSGTSFLDEEDPIVENYNKSRRVHRGLFISDKGDNINADVNGSYQIMKKVFPNAFADGIEGVGLHPVILNVTNG